METAAAEFAAVSEAVVFLGCFKALADARQRHRGGLSARRTVVSVSGVLRLNVLP